MKDALLFILKFGKKEELKSLQKGCLMMKNVHYYKEYEDENNKSVKKGIMNFEDERLFKYPMFCASYISGKNLILVEEKDDTALYKIDCGEIFKDMLKNENFDSVLLMPSAKFLKDIEKACRNNNLTVKAGRVKYYQNSSDKSSLDLDSALDFKNLVFWKDKTYEIEHEFRFIFEGKEIEENKDFILNINDISEYSNLITLDDLKNAVLEFNFKK